MQQEIIFWTAVWAIAAASGIARAMRDSDYDDCISLVSVGLFSGLVGFGIVAVWVGSLGGHIGNELRYLGLSALLGLSGKEHDRFVRFTISQAFTKLGVPPSEDVLRHPIHLDDPHSDHDNPGGSHGGDGSEGESGNP